MAHCTGANGRGTGDKVEGRMAPNSSRRNAIARALAHGGSAAVSRVRYGRYRVASASLPGAAHTVSVDARGAYRCDCPAGVWGRPCWHAAATWLAKLERNGRVWVTGPGTRPP